ncbi:MAG: FtsX-like permease family protein [Treponema sp.]|nr:FtsX-like permease family protein [Treponema sp.]
MKRFFQAMRFYSNLALKTLLYNKKQYASLFTVCVVGSAIMLLVLFSTDGMLKSIRDKSLIYYGGDLVFRGGRNSIANIPDIDEKLSTLDSFIGQEAEFYKRIDCDATSSTLIFEGVETRLWQFRGVDFTSERNLLSGLNITAGDIGELPGRNGILISEFLADKLSAKAGDSLILQTTTEDGYMNTGDVIIAGIFCDSSVFGTYTAYVDIKALDSLIDRGKDYVNRISVYFPNRDFGKKDIVNLQKKLEAVYNMFPLTDDKEDFRDAIHDWDEASGELYGLIPLDANIKDLQFIIDALKAVVNLVIFILLVIIGVGMGSTYRIIVIKRTTEIGTFRALGMKHLGVRMVFITESFYLLVLGFLAGLVLSLLASWGLSHMNLSFVSAFEIFLTKSHLIPSINIVKSLFLFLIVIVTTISTTLFTIRNAVHISPVGALATTA